MTSQRRRRATATDNKRVCSQTFECTVASAYTYLFNSLTEYIVHGDLCLFVCVLQARSSQQYWLTRNTYFSWAIIGHIITIGRFLNNNYYYSNNVRERKKHKGLFKEIILFQMFESNATRVVIGCVLCEYRICLFACEKHSHSIYTHARIWKNVGSTSCMAYLMNASRMAIDNIIATMTDVVCIRTGRKRNANDRSCCPVVIVVGCIITITNNSLDFFSAHE